MERFSFSSRGWRRVRIQGEGRSCICVIPFLPQRSLSAATRAAAGDFQHWTPSLLSNYGGDGALRITAGGGGAFLHPTHGEIEKAYQSDRNSDRPVSYPDPKK